MFDKDGLIYAVPAMPEAAVRTAQNIPEAERGPEYIPDDFTTPSFDTDAAWKRAMGGRA